jgi:hypothetical protein
MVKIPKPEHTVEFKELAVKWVKDGQGIGAVPCLEAWRSGALYVRD